MRHPNIQIGLTLAAATVFVLAGFQSLSAQEPTAKVLSNNDKVRVVEVTYKPDDESKSRKRPVFRVVRALKGGTLQRIYADGKTEDWVMKAGDVKVYDADKEPFATKNVGASDLIFYVVLLKKPKK